ncbi:MAG: AI-2E family transporter [Candidatus Obscuribacterales bacterium]|jgi:predicted PurR-regulated permease PerM
MIKDRSARLTLYLFLAVAAVYVAIQLEALIICLIASLTLAAALAPLAERLEASKRKIPRIITVVVVYFLVGALYIGVGSGLLPVLKEQASSLYDNVPKYSDWLIEKAHSLTAMGGPDLTHAQIAAEDVKQLSMSTLAKLLKVTGSVFGVLINGIFILFLAGYFVVAAKDINNSLLSWLPIEQRQRWAGLIKPIENRLGGYVRGQLLVSLAVGSFIGIGLALIGNEKALILGVLAGLLNLVPFVGSMITSVFAIIISFVQAPWMGFATIVLVVIEQTVESNYIVPTLLGKQVDLHPLIVMFAVIIGGSLLGISGALIAVPVATVSLFLAEEFYQKKLELQQADIKES